MKNKELERSESLQTYKRWDAVAYGDNKFVAVSYDGYITHSADGVTWSEPVAVGATAWYAVIYANKRFVVIGNGGYITTSADGITWSEPTSKSQDDLRSISFTGDGVFVVVGNNGDVITSTDGVDWSSPVRINAHNWYNITYGSGRIVAVGYNGDIIYTK